MAEKETAKKVRVDDNDWFTCPNCFKTFGLINRLGVEIMATCKDCIYYNQCFIIETFAESDEVDYYTEYGCMEFKNKADFVEVDKVSEQIIRKQAEVSDYWQKDVVSYRAMQGYSNIEHDTDNFLRGYNEAVEDMLAILGDRKDVTDIYVGDKKE